VVCNSKTGINLCTTKWKTCQLVVYILKDYCPIFSDLLLIPCSRWIGNSAGNWTNQTDHDISFYWILYKQEYHSTLSARMHISSLNSPLENIPCVIQKVLLWSASSYQVGSWYCMISEVLHHCYMFNPLKPKLNSICYLLALLGVHHFLHVSRIRVKLLTFRLLMSYIYGAPILDVSRSHTMTQHSR